MADEPGDTTVPDPGPGEDAPGWAAPGQQARDPFGGSDAPTGTAPGAVPGAPPPAPPSGPPPGWTAPPAPGAAAGAPVERRRGRTWLVLLIVIVGLVFTAGILGTVLFVDRSLPPYEAASDFIDDIDDRDFTAAFDRLCAADKESQVETLRSLFSGILQGSDKLTTNPLSVDRTDDRATVDFTVSYGDGDDDRTYELHVREEDGEWRPCPGDELR